LSDEEVIVVAFVSLEGTQDARSSFVEGMEVGLPVVNREEIGWFAGIDTEQAPPA
jgi:hypothetical protein